MKRRNLKGCLVLLLATLIWGTAFVFQSDGAERLGPLTFVCCRSVLASAVLFLVSLLLGRRSGGEKPRYLGFGPALLWKAGILSGIFLSAAMFLQQKGMETVSAGKAAFITALYIIFVPIAGIFLKKKPGLQAWIGVLLGAVGMYLLCMKGEGSIAVNDLIILGCAVMFTLQIMVIDTYAERVDCVRLSCIQFAVSALITLPLALIFEHHGAGEILACASPLLFTGVVSGAGGYTLQIIGQKYADVTPATLTMSMESVFAALAGWVLQHEMLSGDELLGCLLIFAAIIFSQIEPGKLFSGKKEKKSP